MLETQYYKIPGSNGYKINCKYNIIDYEGNVLKYTRVRGDKINLTLFGITKLWRLEWIYLISYFDISIIPNVVEHLDDIIFKPLNKAHTNHKIGKLMVFKKPIYYGINNEARIIPNYHRYAIKEDCTIIDTINNDVLSTYNWDNNGYALVSMYMNIDRRSGSAKLHRLMALAFLPNDDYVKKPLVNHIDGDKINNKIENLEWVSNQENASKAVDAGLNPTAKPVLVLDVETMEIKRYRSMKNFYKEICFNSSSTAHAFGKSPGFLLKGRYEVQYEESAGPWYYHTHDPRPETKKAKLATFIIETIDNVTGEVNKFLSLGELYTKYYVPGRVYGIEKILSKARKIYPNVTFKYKPVKTTGPYYVYDIDNDTIITVKNTLELSKIIGYSRSRSRYLVEKEYKVKYKNRYVISKFSINKEKAKHYPRTPNEAKEVITIDSYGYTNKYTRFPGFCLSNSIDLDVAYSFIQEDGTGIVPDSKLRFRLVYE